MNLKLFGAIVAEISDSEEEFSLTNPWKS